MSTERRALAGEDEKGTPRSSFTARQLQERLNRELPAGLAAAQLSSVEWKARMWTRAEADVKQSSVPGDPAALEVRIQQRADLYPGAEATMMQSLGIALDLHTAHHPSLRSTFPWLVKWIQKVLNYVIELEDKVDYEHQKNNQLRGELESASEEMTQAEEEHSRSWAELNSEYSSVEFKLRLEEEKTAELHRRLKFMVKDLEVALAKRDAWKLAAEASAQALRSSTPFREEYDREEYEQAVWDAYRVHPRYREILEDAKLSDHEDMSAALDSDIVIHEGDGTEDDPPIYLGEHVLHTMTAFAPSLPLKPPEK